ncbi:MAG: hypothetical protein V2I36_01645 [Desulfopila sp.]|jgi:hypothetical protein|nr:hypothetical protein [Desulfopila sp.]
MITSHVHNTICFLWVILFFFLTALPAATAQPVRAVYQSVANSKAVFLVEVGNPAPASLIIQHFHPQESRLIGTSPRADKIDDQSGNAKWFLKNVKAGIYPFSLSFNRKVAPETLRLIIRYREPQTGSFQEIVMRP